MGRKGRDRSHFGAAGGTDLPDGESGSGLCQGMPAGRGGGPACGRGEAGCVMVGADAFEAHRGRLIGLAYRMLGSRADAEDAVQDAWLKWSAADRGGVENAEAYLVTV